MGINKFKRVFEDFKRDNRRRRIEKYVQRFKEDKMEREAEERAEQEELSRELLEEKLLDLIEDEVDRCGGLAGLDGETISDILSYYIDGDPRFRAKLEKELRRASNRRHMRF